MVMASFQWRPRDFVTSVPSSGLRQEDLWEYSSLCFDSGWVWADVKSWKGWLTNLGVFLRQDMHLGFSLLVEISRMHLGKICVGFSYNFLSDLLMFRLLSLCWVWWCLNSTPIGPCSLHCCSETTISLVVPCMAMLFSIRMWCCPVYPGSFFWHRCGVVHSVCILCVLCLFVSVSV